MLFQSFSSQDERRKTGGSDFIEFQYCTLSRGTGLKKIVSVDVIKNWSNSSLYLHGNDIEEFLSLYKEIFVNGCYGNGEYGAVDVCGINYYSPEETTLIERRLTELKPKNYRDLLCWLKKTAEFNGFYILGV